MGPGTMIFRCPIFLSDIQQEGLALQPLQLVRLHFPVHILESILVVISFVSRL